MSAYLKLKPAIFKSEPLVLSDSWIGSNAWATLRADVIDGTKSVEVLTAVLKPCRVAEMADANINQLILPAKDRPVTYSRTAVLVDLGALGMARLFASPDGDVAPVNETFVQLLDLYTLHGKAAQDSDDREHWKGTHTCRTLLFATNGASGDDEVVRTIVMPVQLDRERADNVRLCARSIVVEVEGAA